MLPIDTLGRGLRDLRISVTDRCNFRCRYCMPREVFDSEYEFLPRSELLTFEEVGRVASVLVGLGVRKVRLTGGEPLLRRDLADLVEMLAATDVEDIAMTSNGSILARHVERLAASGLDRVTVSLDSLDEETFRHLADAPHSVSDVLEGIDAADRAGLGPVKVNAVVIRGVNDSEIESMADHFRDTGHILRFIEFMDVGSTNGWRMDDVITAKEMLDRISGRWPIEPVDAGYAGEVASRWRYRDGAGEIGVIASVTEPFCGDCTRLRLSAEGSIYTCLFATQGTDLRGPIRRGASDDDLAEIIGRVWTERGDRYSEIRSEVPVGLPKVEMSYIGG
jgi:cyclic pyranopterin phosphate synthase